MDEGLGLLPTLFCLVPMVPFSHSVLRSSHDTLPPWGLLPLSMSVSCFMPCVLLGFQCWAPCAGVMPAGALALPLPCGQFIKLILELAMWNLKCFVILQTRHWPYVDGFSENLFEFNNVWDLLIMQGTNKLARLKARLLSSSVLEHGVVGGVSFTPWLNFLLKNEQFDSSPS